MHSLDDGRSALSGKHAGAGVRSCVPLASLRAEAVSIMPMRDRADQKKFS